MSFLEAARLALPDYDIPDKPKKIRCLFHKEETPSMNMREFMWKCFGCQKGGDVIDLVQGLMRCSFIDALALVELRLGLAHGSDDAEIIALIEAARRGDGQAGDPVAAWRAELERALDPFLRFARIYMVCGDPLVAGIARGPAEAVFDEFDEAACVPPETERAKRAVLASLRREARLYAKWISSEVERATGKDPTMIADQARILRYRKIEIQKKCWPSDKQGPQ